MVPTCFSAPVGLGSHLVFIAATRACEAKQLAVLVVPLAPGFASVTFPFLSTVI